FNPFHPEILFLIFFYENSKAIVNTKYDTWQGHLLFFPFLHGNPSLNWQLILRIFKHSWQHLLF
ncbi:MAG: hypothetical protein PHE26_00860, partial [Syntrophomonadaceae bacterium]|nr:hypothetical protein [Syntrophomonadaceae bacterium]